MSLRLFVYYCAICGAWAALLGWVMGKLMVGVFNPGNIGRAGILAMMLGLLVGLGLGFVDALWNISLKRFGQLVLRVGVALLIAWVGGLIGGIVGQLLVDLTHLNFFVIVGWTIVGFLIGVSVGVYDVLARVLRQEDMSGAIRKILNGIMGGTVGGLLGGILYMILGMLINKIPVFASKDDPWFPSAVGFVALGLCIGLLIGTAQVMLKEAWIRVEAGFRPGRELILSKPEIIIGRAEACDIGLFGGQGVERTHARILQKGNQYLLTDASTPGGTFVNDQRINGPTPLRSGDLIRVGNCVLRFQERKKR